MDLRGIGQDREEEGVVHLRVVQVQLHGQARRRIPQAVGGVRVRSQRGRVHHETHWARRHAHCRRRHWISEHSDAGSRHLICHHHRHRREIAASIAAAAVFSRRGR